MLKIPRVRSIKRDCNVSMCYDNSVLQMKKRQEVGRTLYAFISSAGGVVWQL